MVNNRECIPFIKPTSLITYDDRIVDDCARDFVEVCLLALELGLIEISSTFFRRCV